MATRLSEEIANIQSIVDKITKLRILKRSVKTKMTNVIKWIENHKPANFNEARIRLEP